MAETRSGGRRLSDLARHVVLPDGIVSTAWPDVARQLERQRQCAGCQLWRWKSVAMEGESQG